MRIIGRSILFFLLSTVAHSSVLLPATQDEAIPISGLITDGVVPISAFVIVTDAETGEETESVEVGSDGRYTLMLARGRDYLLNVVADQFESQIVILSVAAEGAVTSFDSEGIAITLGNVALSRVAAAATEAESYFRESVKPDTRSVSRSYSFSGSLIRALPFGGIRNIDSLGLLVPGVAPAPATEGRVGPSFGPTLGTAGQFSVNGLRSRENNFSADGSDNNDEEAGVRRQGFVSPFPQSPESVEEFQIVTTLPEPQFGHNIAAQVNVLSRYGGSRYHGALFGLLTGTPLMARDHFNLDRSAYPSQFRDLIPITANGRLDGDPVRFSLGPSGNPSIRIREGLSGNGFQENPLDGKDPYTRLQTGFALGGPIRNAWGTYLFTSWERQEVHATRQMNFAVPTVQQRGFLDGDSIRLPMARFGPTAPDGDAVFSLFPFPNNPLGPYGPNTFTQNLPADGQADVFLAKIDQQFAIGPTSHILTARHNADKESSVLPATGNALFSSVEPRLRNHNFAMFFTSSLSSRFANTFRASFGRTSASLDEVRNELLSEPSVYKDRPFMLNAPMLMNASNLSGRSLHYVAPDSQAGADHIALWRTRRAGPRITNTSDSLTGPVGEVFVAGYSRIGVDVYHLPQSRAHETYQFADSFSYFGARQQIAAGFDMRRRSLSSEIEKNVRPLFVYPNLRVPEASRIDLPVDLLRSTALVADGSPGGIFQTLAFDPSHVLEFRRNELDLFVQDKFQISDRLQISGGARAIFNALPEEVGDRLRLAFDVDLLRAQATEAQTSELGCNGFSNVILNTRCKQSLSALSESFPADFRQTFGAEKFKTDVRLGFAWNPAWSDSTVIRGGAGTFTGALPTIIANESRDPFPLFLSIQHPGSFVLSPYGYGRLNDFVPLFTKPGSLNQVEFAVVQIDSPDDAVRLAGIMEGANDAFVSLVQPGSALKSPYSRQFTLSVEHQFTPRSSLSIAYVGTQGRRLVRVTTPNKGLYRTQARYWVDRQQIFLFPAQTDIGDRLTVFPSPVGAVQTRFEVSASSSYHGLQTELVQRIGNLHWRTAFTYSHAIDEVSDFFEMAGAFALPQNSQAPSERGSANFDVRLRAVSYFVWDLPFAMQLSGTYTAQSGQPFTVNSSIDSNLDGNLTDRPNTTTGITRVDEGRVKLRLDADPFSLLAPIGQDGVVGRNTFRASGIHNLDLAVTKNFPFGEGYEVQVRAETYNVFNRTHFGMPVRILESPAFGQSVDTSVSPRTIQFSSKFVF